MLMPKDDKQFGRTTGMEADLSTAPYYAIKIAPGFTTQWVA